MSKPAQLAWTKLVEPFALSWPAALAIWRALAVSAEAAGNEAELRETRRTVAALAWLAAPRAGERIWDPFCGSGLELLECAQRAAIVADWTDGDDGGTLLENIDDGFDLEAALAQLRAENARLHHRVIELEADADHWSPLPRT